MSLILLLISLSVLTGSTVSARSSENIRVAILNNQSMVTIKAERLTMEGHRSPAASRIVYTPALIGNKPVRIKAEGDFIQVNAKSYRGLIEIRKKKNGMLLVVNDLDIEDYLKGVIASEVPHDWEFEALKAQAVASRTFALYQKRTSGGHSYHILATVNGQMYEGRSGEREETVKAVEETKGTVLSYKGEVVAAFYHASCGGHTENAMELWGIDEPYLRGVDCECQEISRYGVWEKRLSIPDIERGLTRQGYRVRGIKTVDMKGITAAGRVKELSIGTEDGVLDVPGEKFRAAMGYAAIPSLFFEAALAGNEVIFSGRGLGHGVGLCQWGAREMAQRGVDFKTILSHYYPGTTLSKIEDLR